MNEGMCRLVGEMGDVACVGWGEYRDMVVEGIVV